MEGKTKDVYAELEQVTVRVFAQMAQLAYDAIWVWLVANGWAEEGDKPSRNLVSEAKVRKMFTRYDPVTKYVYEHEIDRKQARAAEAIIASTTAADRAKEINRALRLASGMMAQAAISATDATMLDTYREAGVEQVQWVTVDDERRCEVCRKRHGMVFDIDKVPPKPHPNCRCYLIPYRKRRR